MAGGGVGTVTAVGYLNVDGANLIADQARRLLAGGCVGLLIDLRGAWLVNHHGLLALRRLCDEVARRGSRIEFCNLSSTVARTFEIIGISSICHAAEPDGARRNHLVRPFRPGSPPTRKEENRVD
jgi:anti-anti-sigma regulatory factor